MCIGLFEIVSLRCAEPQDERDDQRFSHGFPRRPPPAKIRPGNPDKIRSYDTT
jgi:hypothetical protein